MEPVEVYKCPLAVMYPARFMNDWLIVSDWSSLIFISSQPGYQI
jgi:hypothetical protein